MKHTPGPWFVQHSSHQGGLLIKPVPGQVVAQCDELPEMQANARLIAAAPDLLAALKALRDYCWNNIAYFGDPVDGDAEANALDRVVDAALAKAER